LPFGLFKKSWEKEHCAFVLQEYGATGSKGWASITEETETLISKMMALEQFKPGKSYRVLARYLDGDHAGQIAGVVWHHHEPIRGLHEKKTEERPKRQEREKEKAPEEYIDAYVENLAAALTPIVKLQAVLKDFQATFAPTPAAATSEQTSEDFAIPPPEYEGKLPIWTHPMVIKSIFSELNAFVDHTANRFEGLFGTGGTKAREEKEEKEEPLLPSIADFTEQEVPIAKEPEPIQTEEAALPMPEDEETDEESAAEMIPSLVEEETEDSEEKGEQENE
jgi:hypothetical protein